MSGTRLWLLVFLSIGMGGCSWLGLGGEDSVELGKAANRPLLCRSGADCNAKWGTALRWVRDNTELPFRQATDALIATDSPQPGSSMSAFEITKTPNGDGTCTIVFDAYCGAPDACDPTLLEHKADFMRTLRGEK